MKVLSRIWFPAVVLAVATAGATGLGNAPVTRKDIPAESCDTIIYPRDGYKLRRKGDFEEFKVVDTTHFLEAVKDTTPKLTARDTVKVPDSLRFTDPFRYKYYVALFDSLTHAIVCDSLKRRVDSLGKTAKQYLDSGNMELYARDTLLHRQDSIDWKQVDSIYLADSAATAKAKFEAWYNSLSRQEKKRYDAEKMLPIKLAEMDSIKKAEEEAQAIKDSIIEFTPRILETFAIPDSMHYHRLITWTADQDFHQLKVEVPDTTYNTYYYDYAFQRKDVNATWLGMAGSPVQYYNYFNRKSDEGVDFYDAQEAWSYSPRTIKHYNTKTPHTELAYWGTLFSKRDKESDNIRVFTTQNISPSLNFQCLYERWGGGGILANEETKNNNLSFNVNNLGKKYLLHAGYIRNTVDRGENGGTVDLSFVQDPTIDDTRSIPVNSDDASSFIKKNTLYLDQQLRIPFNFINKIKAKKDSTFVFNADSLERDITTAFIGHSSEWSTYVREYDETSSGEIGRDSLRVMKLDNKVFIRLQPWSSEGVVSKLNVGIGDYVRSYYENSIERGQKHVENSLYAYGGVEGHLSRYVNWSAKGHLVMLGADAGSMDVQADAGFRFYPFRRAKKSPASFSGHFETSLTEPNYYQKFMSTNHFRWENPDFKKISNTKIEGRIDIPYWKMDAMVGYSLLSGNIYYDFDGMVRQNENAMSVLSASVRKDFTFGPLHLDNRALFQVSSNQDILPLPLLALNLRYYFEFVIQRDASKRYNVMTMQTGVNALYNTKWYAPSWNPALGVFHNQNERLYNNGPIFDVFLNVQWKRACIFVKWENAGKGWPMPKESRDYFTADRYIGTQQSVKIGLFWPFHLGTTPHTTVSKK